MVACREKKQNCVEETHAEARDVIPSGNDGEPHRERKAGVLRAVPVEHPSKVGTAFR